MNKKLIIHHLSFIIRKSTGFTLIELLIVIGIIGILSAFLLSNFVGVRQRARDGVRKSNLLQIQSALELYRADAGSYPASLPTCSTDLSQNIAGANITYIQKIPCDPTNQSYPNYSYTTTNNDSKYTITACIENANDSERDDASAYNSFCDNLTSISYTLMNP
jgi:general secretion pathway protein G